MEYKKLYIENIDLKSLRKRICKIRNKLLKHINSIDKDFYFSRMNHFFYSQKRFLFQRQLFEDTIYLLNLYEQSLNLENKGD